MRTSFAEAYPEIAKTWSDRNLPLTPEQVSRGSTKQVWWKGECGHEWKAIIKNRAHGHGCPYCSGNKVFSGYNDLESQFPQVAEDWSEKNHPLLPDMVTTRAPRKVWWKCSSCGYEWQARIADRTAGSQCPCCSDKIIVPGINDLASLYPDIAAEWSERNEKHPDQISPRAVMRPWWKCNSCGYEWQVALHRRIIGAGQCPICVKASMKQLVNERHSRRAFEHGRLKELLRYQLEYYHEPVTENDDTAIGMPVMFYLPKKGVAIEVNTDGSSGISLKDERIKASLCKKSEILLIRIVGKDSPELGGLNIRLKNDMWKYECEVIETILRLIQILPVSVSMDRNEEAVYQRFLDKVAYKAT